MLRVLVALLIAAPVFAQGAVGNALASVKLGDVIEKGEALVFPLVLGGAPGKAAAGTTFGATSATFAEPAKAARKYNLNITNPGQQPLLVPGGTVVEGGHWDRLIRHDTIVAPGATVEVATLHASGYRKEATGFKLAADMAPFYLRSRANFGASTNEVVNFVSRWLDFRDEGDQRKSLAAISSSDKLKATRQTRGMAPGLKDPKVVGAIACIRGRLQGFVLFGSNEMLQAHFEPLVGGALFSASAIAARGKEIGATFPAQDKDKARELALELLTRIIKASVKSGKLQKGEVGEAWVITAGQTRGRAVSIDGKVVHMAVYPHDPFQHRLYSSQITPEDVAEGDAPTKDKNKEKEEPDTDVNDDERRFLDRHRRRRGGGRR